MSFLKLAENPGRVCPGTRVRQPVVAVGGLRVSSAIKALWDGGCV